MSKRRYRVVVVAPSPEMSRLVVGSLSDAGYEVVLATDFMAGKAALDQDPPDVLIAEVRLGAYNGLHLAIRARAKGGRVQSIVIGPADTVLEAEARQQQVLYLTPPLDGSALVRAVDRVLQHRTTAFLGLP